MISYIIDMLWGCLKHPEIAGFGFLLGWLCPGQAATLVTAVLTAINPIVAMAFAGVKRFFDYLKSKFQKKL